MTSSISDRSHESSNPQQNTSIYPESGGRHEDMASSSSPAHEAVFHQWNDTLTQNYTNAHPGAQRAEDSLYRNPLYRAAQQNPDDVFRPGGKLETSTALNNRTRPDPGFLLSRHQTGLPSMYTSMTTSLPATKEISQFLRRDNVFVTDPQPHGRDLNGLAYNRNTAPAPGIGNALQNAVPYPVSDQAFRQHEVSVPGSIPTESVRGSIPVDQTTGRLNFSEFRKNEHYKSPEDYRHESDDVDQQTLQDSGLANPLSRR